MPLPPRAVVAISEDRQWLVVQRDEHFYVFRDEILQYGHYTRIEDTGESADDVLAAFLREREG